MYKKCTCITLQCYSILHWNSKFVVSLIHVHVLHCTMHLHVVYKDTCTGSTMYYILCTCSCVYRFSILGKHANMYVYNVTVHVSDSFFFFFKLHSALSVPLPTALLCTCTMCLQINVARIPDSDSDYLTLNSINGKESLDNKLHFWAFVTIRSYICRRFTAQTWKEINAQVTVFLLLYTLYIWQCMHHCMYILVIHVVQSVLQFIQC